MNARVLHYTYCMIGVDCYSKSWLDTYVDDYIRMQQFYVYILSLVYLSLKLLHFTKRKLTHKRYLEYVANAQDSQFSLKVHPGSRNINHNMDVNFASTSSSFLAMFYV